MQAVSWADFLLADMLTSLAKSSSDLSRSVCLMQSERRIDLPCRQFNCRCFLVPWLDYCIVADIALLMQCMDILLIMLPLM